MIRTTILIYIYNMEYVRKERKKKKSEIFLTENNMLIKFVIPILKSQLIILY